MIWLKNYAVRWKIDTSAITSREVLIDLLKEYNKCLFRKNEKVKLKKENIVFETKIIEVTADGQLHTKDAELTGIFNFGGMSG